MESVPESSQQQKRKLVTHGLEDQKRVSDRTLLVAWLMVLEWLRLIQRTQAVGGMLLSSLMMLVCLSLVKEAGWWLVICWVPVLGLKPGLVDGQGERDRQKENI